MSKKTVSGNAASGTTAKMDTTTSRRGLLKGSALAGAAILGGAMATKASATGLGAGTARAHRPTGNFRHIWPAYSEGEGPEGKGKPVDLSHLPRVKQELVDPPYAPKHDQVARGGPKIVEIRMETTEKKMVVDEETGAEVWALTFNGSVPGPLIIVHEGDYVELTLVNPADSVMEHNIDFHSSTGALGGGTLTHILPGEETVLRWKATKPGVFIYHCAPGGEMIPYHVAHGMSGTVMVLPRDGLKDPQGNPLRYDDIIYIGEQDYYLPKDENGDYIKYEGVAEDLADSLDAMRTLIPTHSVFNGKVGSMTGANALKSKVGKTVLMIHGQANRDSRPHLIGGHADYVWQGGSFTDVPDTGFETWFIRGGSSGAAMYTFKQPGTYVYLNHNLIEAILLGAAAQIQVEGEWDNDLMAQVVSRREITKA